MNIIKGKQTLQLKVSSKYCLSKTAVPHSSVFNRAYLTHQPRPQNQSLRP